MFQRALIERGITPEKLAELIDAELNACEVKVFWDSGDSEAKCSDPLIAWSVRQRARMDACRLLDLYPAERHELSGQLDHTVSLTALLDEIAERQAPLVQEPKRRGRKSKPPAAIENDSQQGGEEG